MNLHSVKHTNKSRLWCGLAAISAVTGIDTKTIAQCLRRNGRKAVKGIRTSELVSALKALGTDAQSVYVNGKPPTLCAWARQNRQLFATAPVIVVAGRHFQVLQGIRLCDSFNPEPVLFSSLPAGRRRRVEAYVQILKVGDTPCWTPPPAPKKDWKAIRARAGLLGLAKQHGIVIEDYNPGEWWVYPPHGFPVDKDPYEMDGHLAFGADDRAERIRTYLKLLDVKPSYE